MECHILFSAPLLFILLRRTAKTEVSMDSSFSVLLKKNFLKHGKK